MDEEFTAESEPIALQRVAARTEAAPLAEPVAMEAPRIGTVMPEPATLPNTTAPAAPVAPSATSPAADGGGGSAGSGFKVSPEQYQAAVSPLLAAADQISELYTALNSYLSGLDAPWGNDHAGHQFADGDKGYLKYAADTLDGLKALPDGLRNTADGIKAMAENYTNIEQNLASGMDSQDQELQATQGTYWSPSSFMPASPVPGRIEEIPPTATEHGPTSGRH